MEPSDVFDRVLASLGFKRQIDLAVALGRKPRAAWNWRNSGFPKRVQSELQVLAGRLDRPLPHEFYTYTSIPPPHYLNANEINAPTEMTCPQNPTRKKSINSTQAVENDHE